MGQRLGRSFSNLVSPKSQSASPSHEDEVVVQTCDDQLQVGDPEKRMKPPEESVQVELPPVGEPHETTPLPRSNEPKMIKNQRERSGEVEPGTDQVMPHP